MEEKDKSQEVELKLAKKGLDPIDILAMYAEGDVVGLGLMTKEDLEEEEIYDEDGRVIQKSGVAIAAELIPPKLRQESAKELAQYLHAKKRGEDKGLDQDNTTGTVLYMPDNGRAQQQPPKLRVVGDESA